MTCNIAAVHAALQVLLLTVLCLTEHCKLRAVQTHKKRGKRFRSRALHTSSGALHMLSTDLMCLSLQLHLWASIACEYKMGIEQVRSTVGILGRNSYSNNTEHVYMHTSAIQEHVLIILIIVLNSVNIHICVRNSQVQRLFQNKTATNKHVLFLVSTATVMT